MHCSSDVPSASQHRRYQSFLFKWTGAPSRITYSKLYLQSVQKTTSSSSIVLFNYLKFSDETEFMYDLFDIFIAFKSLV